MLQFSGQLGIHTRGKGLYEVTSEITSWLSQQPVSNGLLTIYVKHTSTSLVIQENADRDVQCDLADFFSRLVPDGDKNYRHTSEGPDDMSAHIRSTLTQTHLGIPVTSGRLGLGTWQGIFVFEHRSHPHHRGLTLHLIGE